MSHSEPWSPSEHVETKTVGVLWFGCQQITGSDGMPMAVAHDEETRDRIMACVNACRGIPTEALQDATRVAKLLPAIICPKCGGLSWDVPLTDYCRCDPNPVSRTKKTVREILDG